MLIADSATSTHDAVAGIVLKLYCTQFLRQVEVGTHAASPRRMRRCAAGHPAAASGTDDYCAVGGEAGPVERAASDPLSRNARHDAPRGAIRARRQSTKRPASTSRRALNSVYVTCELVPVVRCTERAVRRSERLQLVSATASMTVRGSYRSEFAALWDGFALPFPPSLPQ